MSLALDAADAGTRSAHGAGLSASARCWRRWACASGRRRRRAVEPRRRVRRCRGVPVAAAPAARGRSRRVAPQPARRDRGAGASRRAADRRARLAGAARRGRRLPRLRAVRSRTQTVFGVGHPQAHWMIVGEAPGEQEDLQGEPFVGPAGQLLDSMLRALGLTRARGAAASAQVFIANTLKCRPPRNRNPEPAELARCEPFLRRQIELVQPRIILAMGRFAVQALLRSDEPIGRLRGRVHRYRGVPLVVTYHPAYLLRNLADKARAWEDLCLAAAVLERQAMTGGGARGPMTCTGGRADASVRRGHRARARQPAAPGRQQRAGADRLLRRRALRCLFAKPATRGPSASTSRASSAARSRRSSAPRRAPHRAARRRGAQPTGAARATSASCRRRPAGAGSRSSCCRTSTPTARCRAPSC